MKKTNKGLALGCVLLGLTLGTSNIKTVSAETSTNIKTNTTVVYNHKILDFGDKSVVNKDGSVYIPLRAFGDELGHYVYWVMETNTAIINDGLHKVELSKDGTVKIDGKVSKSDKVPINVEGSTYVPLRFISESLGVDVDYNSKDKTVTMTGIDVYEISQEDLTKPHLIAYTKDGGKDLGLIADRTGKVKDENNKTYINKVERTGNSDVIQTTYVPVNTNVYIYDTNIYVHDGVIIDITNSRVCSYDTSQFSKFKENTRDGVQFRSGGEVVRSYDDRMATLNRDNNGKTTVKLYNDKTGELISTIDPMSEYGYEINNIQAVGKDFMVATMVTVENEYYKNRFTAIVKTDTKEVIPVVDYFNNKEMINLYGDLSNIKVSKSALDYPSTDALYFDSKDGDKFKFIAYGCPPNSDFFVMETQIIDISGIGVK